MTNLKAEVRDQRSEIRRKNFCLLPSAFPSGFTLIELAISVVIMAIVAGITTHYLVSASRLYTLLLAQEQADGNLADAVGRMRREARLHVQTISADSNVWIFSNTHNATTTCRWSGAEIKLNDNRMATGVERFVLSYYDATNGPLQPLPLTTDCARITRVALDIKAANNMADSELKINFFLQENMLK
ncbi:MAG: prepilin-type N-terminal cleavage/methylation domain-containing protein [Kiritimatiellae bacterium]|nr:prepilin-type N-terminal cleavage/methylation domain-containing protein [Kiritimatiellia bacterium]